MERVLEEKPGEERAWLGEERYLAICAPST
jgi:hypothetical protein